MSLYSNWQAMGESFETEQEQKAFWDEYFSMETENYKKILSADTAFEGKLSKLAEDFEMSPEVFCGFMSGINESLKTPVDVEKLKIDSKISLDYDAEKLYFNMLDAKATWLWGLSEWEPILSKARRKDILKDWRASKQTKVEVKPGRNDPCPCGSGKKYKKCCGAK